jgi:ubiquinone/menaquinone biosynthesis C-methylase UbiE
MPQPNGAAARRAVQDLVDAYFERTSSSWVDIYRRDDVLSHICQQRRNIALTWVDQLRLPAGADVLDVGCGAGLTAVALARRGLRVHAIDTVATMIELTQWHATEAGLSDAVDAGLGDVHALRFDDEAFDLVVALGVLPWLHSPLIALQEMARVTRTGGTVIATANNVARLNYLLDPWLNPHLASTRAAVKRILRRHKRRGGPGSAPANLHSLDEVERLLSSAGLVKQTGQTIGHGPFTFMKRRVLPNRVGMEIHRRLQRRADRGNTWIAARGLQYIVAARKEPSRSLRSARSAETGEEPALSQSANAPNALG